MNQKIQDEQLDSLKHLLHSRLSTKVEVKQLADNVGLSVPTVYRYKKEPEIIPYGMYLKIKKYFNQLENTPDYILPSPDDFVLAEERRLFFEQECAGGERYVVTPVFSVTCETEEFTKLITSYDYPEHHDLLDKFVKIRQKRRAVFESGVYNSYELIDATKYRDFFLGVNRFVNLSRKDIDKQIDYLVKSTGFDHVDRRIYLYATPELPTVSCYKVKTYEKDILKCIVRNDDFVQEFTDETSTENTNELFEMFNKYFYWETNLKNKEDVIRFLRNPMIFPMF